MDPEAEPDLLGREVEILGRERVRLERRREFEPPRPRASRLRRRMPRWQKVTVAAVALALAFGLYVDRAIGQHENAALAGCGRELRSASLSYDTRMGAMYDYLRPALGMLTAAQGRMVSNLMAVPARRVLPLALAARDRCRGVHVLPWHSSTIAARAADLGYADALVGRLRDVAERVPGFRIDDRRLTRLRTAAGIPPALGS